MPEVTVRDAQRGDSRAIGEIWSVAVPYLVRSSARAAADVRADRSLGRRRWVGLVGNQVAGTATAGRLEGTDPPEVLLGVEVRPDLGSRGVGSALLAVAASAFGDARLLHAVCSKDPVAMAFAVRNGFLPEGEDQVAVLDPSVVPRAEAPPAGMRPVNLEALPDLRMLLETHNLAALDDPSAVHRPMTLAQLRAAWWGGPDNAPELSWGLLAEEPPGSVLAAFTSVLVDRERGRAWSSTTATRPSYRGRGLARWVKQRMLNALDEAGLTEAWAANDCGNTAMLAVNRELGYTPVATSVRMSRRMGR